MAKASRRYFHNFIFLWALTILLFLSSCRSTADLVLDDPAFLADMVHGALQGEKFKITPEDYPGIRKLLQDEHSDYRLAGVILAGQAAARDQDEGRELYPDIVNAALDENTDVSDAAKELIYKDPETYRKYLKDLLDSTDPSRRIGGLSLLSSLGEEDLVPFIIESFSDPDPDVRNQASLSVKELTDRNNPFLREALESPDSLISSTAYLTLGRYADIEDAPLFIAAFSSGKPDVRREAQLAMLRLGEAGLPFLHQLALDSSQSYKARLAALEVIQGLRSTRSLKTLFLLLDDEDERFRVKSETILGTYGSEAIPQLSDLYRDSEETNRLYAVRLMGKIESPAGLPLLTSAINDPSPKVRAAAMDSLRRFEDAARPALHSNLSDNAILLLMEGADPWLVTLENGEPNFRALFMIITAKNISRGDLDDYLNRAEISKLKAETILSLKDAWIIAEDFSSLDKVITEGRNPYLNLWRRRELNMVASREILKKSFTELHEYFETRDPSNLDKASATRAESRRLEDLARAQKAEIDSMDEDVKARGQELLERYKELRVELVRIWEFVIPSMTPLAARIYRERGVNPESLADELAILE